MTRRPFFWLLDTVAMAAAATVGVCVFVRGILTEGPPKTGKRTVTPLERDPFTGLPEERTWN